MTNISILYAASVQPLLDTNTYESYYSLLPAERKAKIGRMRQEADRIRSVAARALLARAYEDYCIRLGRTASIDRVKSQEGSNGSNAMLLLPKVTSDSNGKPCFVDSDIKFNLSHSKDRVLCAMSLDEVGCDVESKSDNALKIAKRFFTEYEYNKICAIEDKEQQEKCFTQIWTMKESVLKAAGCGIAYPMNEFATVDSSLDYVEYLDLKWDGNRYYIKQYDSNDEYQYCICSKNSTFNDEMIIIQL